MRSTCESSGVFNSRDEIYLVFTEKGSIFFLFYTFIGYMQCLKGGAKMQKTIFLANPNSFGTKIFVTF